MGFIDWGFTCMVIAHVYQSMSTKLICIIHSIWLHIIILLYYDIIILLYYYIIILLYYYIII